MYGVVRECSSVPGMVKLQNLKVTYQSILALWPMLFKEIISVDISKKIIISTLIIQMHVTFKEDWGMFHYYFVNMLHEIGSGIKKCSVTLRYT
jgi:hypothetical protein